MLSILNIGSSAKSHEYYVEYAQEAGEPPGHFWGRGAEALDLAQSSISSEQMQNLLRGFSPDRKTALCQNAGDDHRGGWDCTFSAPKSVSIAWSSADEILRQNLEAGQAKAVDAALQYIEKHGAQVRAGKGGRVSHPASIVAATFEHGSSRAGEPQLHTHAIVFNVAQSNIDRKWRTLESRHVYLMQMAASSFYKAELAHQIRALGFTVERTKDSFEIVGVPKDVCDAQSSRAKEIKERLEDAGFDSDSASARSKELAALHTRTSKGKLGRDFEGWHLENKAHGFGSEELLRIRKNAQPVAISVDEIAIAAGEKLSSERSTFAFYEFDRAVAENAIGKLGVGEIKEALEHAKKQSLVFEVGKGKWGETRLSTPAIVEVENRIVEILKAREGEQTHVAKQNVAVSALRSRENLSDEQQKAILLLTQGADGIQFVEGQAGTGKSFMLGVVREVYEKSGFEVVGLSYTNKAAKNLETSSGIKSRSVDSFLYAIEKNRAVFSQKSIVVVDEAGMLDSRKTLRLSELCYEAKAKLVFVGDAQQIQPILAGQPFETQKNRSQAAELAQIFRQTERWERDAVKNIRDGNVVAALKAFDAKGGLHICETRKDIREKLILDWFSQRKENPALDTLIVVSKNREVDALNEAARNRLVEAKIIEPGVNLTTAHGAFSFSKGDKIVFTGNLKSMGIQNSVLSTIEFIDSKKIIARTEDNRQVVFNPQQFKNFRHGYAITAHKSQGSTVDRSFVLVDGFNMDKEKMYVAVSRGRKNNSIYADITSLREMPLEERRKLKNLPFEKRASAKRAHWVKEIASITGVSHQKDTTQDYGLEALPAVFRKGKSPRLEKLKANLSQTIAKMRDFVNARFDALNDRALSRTANAQDQKQQNSRDKSKAVSRGPSK